MKYFLILGGDHMANLKSAIKRVRTNNKKRESNTGVKSRMRTKIKQTDSLIEAKDVENATQSYHETVREIDKAIQKGVIHRNNGNRHKARLANKLNKLNA